MHTLKNTIFKLAQIVVRSYKNKHTIRPYASQSGLTLIELLVVMSLLTILLVSATSLFLMNMKSGARTSARQDLKQEGLFLMNQIEYMIKNSVTTPEGQCSSDGGTLSNDFIFTNINNQTSQIVFIDDPLENNLYFSYIAPAVSGLELMNPTSVDVYVTGGAPTIFHCFINTTGEKFVMVKFELRRNNSIGDVAENAVTESFERLIQLRN